MKKDGIGDGPRLQASAGETGVGAAVGGAEEVSPEEQKLTKM